MKNLKFIGVLCTLLVAAFAIVTIGNANAQVTTPTTLGITQGVFSFYKDLTTDMSAYITTAPNTDATIDIGNYDSSLAPIAATSSGDHRFTVSDLKGDAFTITLSSSKLSYGALDIPAKNIGYVGTAWLGTGKVLTAAPTTAADIWTSPVTFVSRADNLGVSKYSQEITIKVAVPAAQTPGSYTGVLTFTTL